MINKFHLNNLSANAIYEYHFSSNFEIHYDLFIQNFLIEINFLRYEFDEAEPFRWCLACESHLKFTCLCSYILDCDCLICEQIKVQS